MAFLGTLPETNIAPKNGWLEYDPFLLGFGLLSGAGLLVSGRVYMLECIGWNAVMFWNAYHDVMEFFPKSQVS